MLNIPIKYMMSGVWIQPIPKKKVFDSVTQSEYHNIVLVKNWRFKTLKSVPPVIAIIKMF